MTVSVMLSLGQQEHLQALCKKKEMEINIRNGIIEFDKESFLAVQELVKTEHTRLVKQKTKTVTHLEKIYELQQLLHLLDKTETTFKAKPLPEIVVTPEYEPAEEENVE